MTPAAASHPPLPPPTAELLDLFERLSLTTRGAFAALEQGELEEVAARVEEREHLLSLVAPLLEELRLLRQRSGAVPSRELGSSLAAVEHAAHDLLTQDRELVAEMSRLAEEISAGLRQMNQAAAARTAYSRSAPPPPAR